MPKHDDPTPKTFKGVMVSSTFDDLQEHRDVLIKIIGSADMKPVAMEHDSAKPGMDVIASSLDMVRKGAAYVGIIATKYGQTPICGKRNPNKVSITELEFDQAIHLGRPILLFIMGENHPVLESQVELKPRNRKKLKAFRERAKKMGPDTEVHRVYATFNSVDEFKEMAAQSIAELRRFLERAEETPDNGPLNPTPPRLDPIPTPPAFYAEPPYLGSHRFVGRRDQLETLDEWSLPADSHPLLLFEAIGGTGKSMLTWEWVRHGAPAAGREWAGRFWYSFYERGAIMADFCRHALAYMTGQPLAELTKKKTTELAPQLLHQLQARPWLLVLDGLERVLVAYNRIDAAQLRDEEAGQTDAIAQRDPCAAIRPEDDDLLRLLASAAPSKLLLTSRLIPRVLLNSASQPIPGVLHQRLPGLRPADAEALFRACGVSGDSTAIQTYLKSHCDCHPLTIGALAGLVTHYLSARGNFDSWCADPNGGGKLNFADLDLTQRRNHILTASIGALPADSRRLLSMIALLAEAVDFQTLAAINPHLPPAIEEVAVPERPEERWDWEYLSTEEREEAFQGYPAALERRAKYEQAVEARLKSAEFLAAPRRLGEAIADLERRGLLQYERQARHYDLHPVVRGIVAGGLATEEKVTLGQRVVDHFSARPHNPYEDAETLDDLRDGLHVVRTLVQMGRFDQACAAYRGDLAHALLFNLEAHAEVVALLRPFFTHGWSTLPPQLDKNDACYLANDAALALGCLGQEREALAVHGSTLASRIELKSWPHVLPSLNNLAICWLRQNRLANADLCMRLVLEVASLLDVPKTLFRARLGRFEQLARLGQWPEADAMWQALNPMGRQWSREVYRPGLAEYFYAEARFWEGGLQEEELISAEELAGEGRNRQAIRMLHGLRGAWRLEQGEWAMAAASLHEAVTMAQEVGLGDPQAETRLALARFHLGQLPEPRSVAERLAKATHVSHLSLALLWQAIGDHDAQAKHHALAAYRWAWADGEPFVRRYGLNKARELLADLGVEPPRLPPYDPAKAEKLPWEDAVRAAIAELRAEKAATDAADTTKPAPE